MAKQNFLFRYDYGTGSTIRCFYAHAPGDVSAAFPEFTQMQWEGADMMTEGRKQALIANAFDMDRDPRTDPMLLALIQHRELEARYENRERGNH